MKHLLTLIPFFTFGQVQTDKAWHVACGTVISATATAGTYLLTERKDVSLLVGFLSGTAAGIAKEVYDKKTGNGTPSQADLLWTIAGAGIGSFGVTIIIDKPKSKQLTYL